MVVGAADLLEAVVVNAGEDTMVEEESVLLELTAAASETVLTEIREV